RVWNDNLVGSGVPQLQGMVVLVTVVVVVTEAAVSSSTRSVTKASTVPPIRPASPVPLMHGGGTLPSALVKASLSFESSPQVQPGSTLAPCWTAFEKQLDFLNAFFPAAFSFCDVQRLAALLMPTSDVFTSLTSWMTLGLISVVPVAFRQAPSPSAEAKASDSFVSSASRQLVSTGLPVLTAFE